MQSNDATTPPGAATFDPPGQGLRSVQSSGSDEERYGLPRVRFARPATSIELDRFWRGDARTTGDEFCIDRMVTAQEGADSLPVDEAAYAAYLEDYNDENDVDELPTPQSWAYATGRGEVPA